MTLYLVTGGLGFIGSHVVDRLVADGHKVRILDDLSTGKRENAHPEAEVMVGDVSDSKVVARAMENVKGCVHLAAIASVQKSVEDWAGTHRTNLTGTVTILNEAKQHKTPVVYASSAAVYGNRDVPAHTEHSPTVPLTAYGADKLGCELHAKVAWEVFGVPVTGLRFFNVYGPRQDPHSPYSGVISIFAARVLNGESLTIHGDGEQTRDFVFVGDVVRCVLAALYHPKDGAEVYNVCTGKASSILTLAKVLMQIREQEVPIFHGPARKGDILKSLGDPAAFKARFGFYPSTSLEAGLSATLASL